MSTLSETAPGPKPSETGRTLSTPVPAGPAALPVEADEVAFDIKNFSLWYGPRQALMDVTIKLPARKVTAIIGPCGR
jgi:ABC-type multidrug transport system fused ATPase/permease subunit